MSTEELIKRCLVKDLTAWDEFVRRYQGLVSNSVRYKLAKLNVKEPRKHVKDLVQDIFLYIWEKDKLSGIRDMRSIDGWLVMLSLNSVANYCRNMAFRESEKTLSLNKVIYSEKGSITLGDVLPSPLPATTETIDKKELGNILEREMGLLNTKEQLAIKLNYYDGKTHKDISEIMNMPENSVATLIRRGKMKLRERLEDVFKDRQDIKENI